MGRSGRGRHVKQDDGWEQHGGYFAAKKAKLDDQYNIQDNKNESILSNEDVQVPQIFKGVTVYINGYTNPPEPELRKIFTRHGGKYTSYLTANTNFVIASNLPMAKKKLLATKTLKASWITDSVGAGKKLDHRNYMLYNLNAENKQSTLSLLFKKPACTDTNVSESLKSGQEDNSANSQEGLCEQIVEQIVKVKNASDDQLVQTEDRYSLPSSASSEILDGPEQENSTLELPGAFRTVADTETRITYKRNNNTSGASTSNKLKTAGEDGFLADFYNHSRLHLISTMKKEVQQMVSEWRRNLSTHKFPLADVYADSLPLIADPSTAGDEEDVFDSGSTEQVVFHVDLDCFFVAVGRLSRPHLMNKPIVVTHSKGKNADSRSDISCASYEARAKGVKAGMWLDQAKKLCPEVEAIPYEFDEYKVISKIFFETVGKLTLEMEAISIDEMVLNVTHIIRETSSNPALLAAFLRKAIQAEAKINASIGIGSNKLAAKIATRVAKDTQVGHFYMKDSSVREYIRKVSVKKLPGVGYATADRLATQFNVHTGSELEGLTMEELKRGFGVKTGEKLYSLCRGIDNDSVNCEAGNAKSLSAGCSWGVRFKKTQELDKFIRDLTSEISNRAAKAKCFGSKVTLSLWVVKKGYLNVTVKPGGHGIVDIFTKSQKLLQHTRETAVISSTVLGLSRSIVGSTIPAERIRGVSISMDGLRHECDMSEKEKKTVQTDLFSAIQNRKCASHLKYSSSKSSSTAIPNKINPNATNPAISVPASPLQLPLKTTDKIKSITSTSTTICSVITAGAVPPNKSSEKEIPAPDSTNPTPIVLLDLMNDPTLQKFMHKNKIEAELIELRTNQKALQVKKDVNLDSASFKSNSGSLKSDKCVQNVNENNTSSSKLSSESPTLNLNSPEVVNIKPSELEMDIFTGDLIQGEPVNEFQVSPVKILRISNSNQISKATESGESGSSSNIERQTVINDTIESEPEINFPETSSKPASNVKIVKSLPNRREKPTNLENEYDPAVQQKILESFKKLVKLPSLNGECDMKNVQNLILRGVTNRIPTDEDLRCLESYFKDLTAPDCPFLEETCQTIDFLEKLQVTLKLESGRWCEIWERFFARIIPEMQSKVFTIFGGRYGTF